MYSACFLNGGFMQNEEQRTARRFEELARRAFDRGFYTFTDFLNLDEQSTLLKLRLPSQVRLFGGFAFAERQMACFYDGAPPAGSDFPLTCLKIAPAAQKFAEALTHRDFLGALMGLGLKRETLGDIVLFEKDAYLFCAENMAGYIADNLREVRRTNVMCTPGELPSGAVCEPKEKEVIVPSLRADALIAAVFHLSRSEVKTLFAQKKVFINSRLCENSAQALKENDVVSLRGHGRFIFSETLKTTKKDRLVAEIKTFE